jgi:hypothetical protein
LLSEPALGQWEVAADPVERALAEAIVLASKAGQ